MSFKEIVSKAIERNCDIDKNGNIDGAVFAAEQILQDMEKAGYKILTQTGKAAGSGLVNHHAVRKRRS